MEKTELQKEIDRLGILNIEASGDLTSSLVRDAINSTKDLYEYIDFDALAKEIDKKEGLYK